jgi:tetratricopeptide (TPR) repeat protein
MKQPSQKEAARIHWNQTRASVLLTLAQDQYVTGNFDKSRQTTDEALAMDPQNAGLRILSAKLAIEKGRLEYAEGELKIARTSAPKNAEADYLAGVIYQRWQKLEVALNCYKAASAKAPTELAYLMAQAEMLVAMDQQGEALKLLESKVTYFEHSATIRTASQQLHAHAHGGRPSRAAPAGEDRCPAARARGGRAHGWIWAHQGRRSGHSRRARRRLLTGTGQRLGRDR